MEKIFSFDYLGSDDVIYDAIMKVEKDGDQIHITECYYYDTGGITISLDRDCITEEEKLDAWENGDVSEI